MADHRHTLNSLPKDITLNIFSRLPAKAVLDCKQVCRSWRNLLHSDAGSNYFAYQHLENQRGGVFTHQQDQNLGRSAVMSFVAFDREAQALYYSEYGEDPKDNKPVYHRRRINLKLPVRMFDVVCSCDGLICLSIPPRFRGLGIRIRIDDDYSNFNYYPTEEPSHICNPITREFVKLPAICIGKKKKKGVRIVSGFGYHPQTYEYKVVRISYIGASDNLPITAPIEKSAPSGLVEIYTLGSGGEWRTVGETNFWLVRNQIANSVCANGSLHWLHEKSEDIVAFDLAQEEFHLVPTPPCRLDCHHRDSRLCVIRSCVCLVYEYTRCDYYDYEVAFDLWLLKENRVDESSTGHHKKEQPDQFRSWSKEFSVEWIKEGDDMIALYMLFALTEGGELLIHDPNHGISRYNETTRKLRIPNDMYVYETVPLSHINSFVSLKALGETNVETIMGSKSSRRKKRKKIKRIARKR